ncbi:hypothetical protein KIPB_017359, partial [Kipferlia bialata]
PGRINMPMQTAFFQLSEVIPVDDAVSYLKEAVLKTFKSKGEKVVAMNNAAIDLTLKEGTVTQVAYPANWGEMADSEVHAARYAKAMTRFEDTDEDFIKDIFVPIYQAHGQDIPVSKVGVGTV